MVSTYEEVFDRPRRRVEVQRVLQVALQLQGQNAFEKARREALAWIDNRVGRSLPRRAWEGEDFELGADQGLPVEAVRLGDHIWATRLDDIDKNVPGRTWTTELVLGRKVGEVLFGCRLTCTARGENPHYVPAVPGVVRQMVDNVGARLDGRPVAVKPWAVDSDEEVEALYDLLVDGGRTRPVLIVSRPPGGDPVADVERIALRLLSLAHVVDLHHGQTFVLTDRVGKRLSVFHGGIRLYRAGFDPDVDSPYRHPLWTRERIRNWEGDADGFVDWLVGRIASESVSRPRDVVENEVPSFRLVARLAAEAKAREGHATIDDLKRQVERERAGRIEAEELWAETEQKVKALEEAVEQKDQEIYGLRARIDHLEHALRSRGASESSIPESFDDLEGWVERELSGSVHVLPRAFRAAKKSGFKEPALAYRALLALRDHYVPLRRGEVGPEGWEAAMQALGLENSPAISDTGAGQQGDEYFVWWNGRRRKLDMHLKRGTSRDERRCFRLYYFWDDETRQVVVGSFPGHLDTEAT